MRPILKRFGLIGRLKKDRTDDLLQRGIDHFAEGYPNTNRSNCPPLELLSALVQSGKLPPDEIREHLFTCSECFVHYREELSRRSTLAAVGSAAHDVRRPRLVPIVAAALVGILAVSAIVFVVVKRENQQTGERASVSSRDKDPAPEGPSSGLAAISPEPKPPRVATESRSPVSKGRNDSRPLIAKNKLTIDLDRYNALRGTSRSEDSPILLHPTKNELTVKLPDGSPAGRYLVSLADPFGTSVQSVEAVSRDGVQLRLNLDLSSIKSGKYLVCLARETEVPQCVPAMIEPRRNRK